MIDRRVHVANVDSADSGERWRTITAGQRVIHTLANDHGRRRPRDGRGMSDSSARTLWPWLPFMGVEQSQPSRRGSGESRFAITRS